MKKRAKRTKRKFWKYLYMAPDNYALALVASILYQLAICIDPLAVPIKSKLTGNFNKQRIFLNRLKAIKAK